MIADGSRASNEVLYVSPHPDDVAFSAAGHLARDVSSGARVTVLTLFEAPPGRGPRNVTDLPSRRAEDEAFARSFGVALERGPWLDAVARRLRYRLPQCLFGRLAKKDWPIIEAVRASLQARVDAGCSRVVGPLGVGGHVDHQIAHLACRRLERADVQFYEDAPYVFVPHQLPRRLLQVGVVADGPPDETLAHDTALSEFFHAAKTWIRAPFIRDALGRGLAWLVVLLVLLPQWSPFSRKELAPIRRLDPSMLEGSDLLEVKLRAIACYPSQWKLFYAELDDWRDAMERYGHAAKRSGPVERVWRAMSSGD
jgi:LmbE family N-acetylglucosaminyl deacetylase